jgi:DnaK suppressor protein
MSDANGGLSPQFIQAQRKRLETLRSSLLGAEGETREREQRAHEEHAGDPGDAGDKAPPVEREVHQALHDTDNVRLENIERALRKIDEGTYGLSDASGKPIPKARLEVVPEAVLTVDEAGR